MRLVIHSQGAAGAGLRRYNGKGIFSSIGRKLFSFGLKKVINAMERKNHSHTIADAVVNGRPHPIDNNSKNFRKEKIVKAQRKGVKRKKVTPKTTTTSPSTAKVRKYSKDTTNQLINIRGSGIVLD